MKDKKGFTLVELVVVIAVLSVLVGIATPRFLKAGDIARGSQLLANMYTCEEAVNRYYAEHGAFPENAAVLVSSYLAVWPRPPVDKAIIKKDDGNELVLTISASSYVYVKPISGELNTKLGRVTLGGMTIEDLLSTTATSLTLPDIE